MNNLEKEHISVDVKNLDLTIIIVNYKSCKLVTDCIESVYRETSRHSFEIVVVDNDSGDNCREVLSVSFPEVKWLQMGYNSGFARANNAAIRIARGKNVLLLNSDTIVLNRALDKVLDLFEKDSQAVACGVQLLNTDGSHQISGAHFVKGGFNFLLPLPYLGRFIRYWGYKLKTRVPSITSVQEKVSVDWIVGAFLMARSEVVDKAGLLDEDFFMYAEEIEWCSRLRKQGDMYLYGEPQVIHLGGATSGDYYDTTENENGKNLWNKKGRQVMLSMMVRIRKQYGVFWFLIMLGIFIVEIPIFAVGVLIEKIFKRKVTFSWKNLSNYIENLGCVFNHFTRIINNKPYFYKTG
ncbi:glycosyltransferase family 2 protein [Danxiaibacter flavus]|uniref:Glycosyltransferase family 2 protein n=1 Tax=Danxiaibacter flavus TaxID=3049108 RepID=A0ABV3ZC11_9BACT|nr:glycosyltransferase family 2 protein [Chitinophagaceae bacterium DXS]